MYWKIANLLFTIFFPVFFCLYLYGHWIDLESIHKNGIVSSGVVFAQITNNSNAFPFNKEYIVESQGSTFYIPTHENLRNGQTIEFLYDPDDPTNVLLGGKENELYKYFFKRKESPGEVVLFLVFLGAMYNLIFIGLGITRP